MRVSSNTLPNALSHQLERLSRQQVDLQQQVSSGLRISAPSDDPGAAARVLQAQSAKRELAQFDRNRGRADDLLTLGRDAIDQLRRTVVRAQELTLRAGDLTADEDLAAIREEVDQLLEQGLILANTRHGETFLFGEGRTGEAPFGAARDAGGAIAGVSFTSGGEPPVIAVGEGAALAPFSTGETNAALADLLNGIAGLRDALAAGDRGAAANARPSLDEAEATLVSAAGDLVSKQARLEAAGLRDNASFLALEGRVSAAADVDIAGAIVRLNQNRTAYQAALQSGALILSQTLLDFL